VNKWELWALLCQAGATWSRCRAWRRDVSVAQSGAGLTSATSSSAARPSAAGPSEWLSAADGSSAVPQRGGPAGATDVRGRKALGCCGCSVLDPETKVAAQRAAPLLRDLLLPLTAFPRGEACQPPPAPRWRARSRPGLASRCALP